MRLCSATEMMSFDRQATAELGIPGTVLMETAGRACCDQFVAFFGKQSPCKILIVAGKGNNGGDGYVMARVLVDRGYQVVTLVLGEEKDITGDAKVMLQIIQKLGVTVKFVTTADHLDQQFGIVNPAIIVDAIFGTGLKSTVRGLQEVAIRLINESTASVLSVDIPSGVDSSNGRVCGVAVQADTTVTFDHAKIGHGSMPGALNTGKLCVADIGIPQAGRPPFTTQVNLLDRELVQSLLPPRSARGHKGKFGHLLVVAGSTGKTGAASLAGNSGVRSGCGLVTVATPATIHDIIEIKLTEAMSYRLIDHNGFLTFAATKQIEELLVERQALAIGPGLGQSPALFEMLAILIANTTVPIVIDADGLNLLAGQLDCLPKKSEAQIVLTPHPGEMARLTGLTIAEIEADRFNIAQKFAIKHNVILVLKGPRTIVAAPDQRVNINTSGNDGLASGGSGDVLTGLIGGLLAQGVDVFTAASLAVWLHGRAAELVAVQQGTAGMVASDLLSQLPVARAELVKGAN